MTTKPRLTSNHFIYYQMDEHLRKLTKVYSKMLPLRIDLHYSLDDNKQCNKTIQQACNDIKALTTKLFECIEHLVGFVWVMEVSKTDNIHFHTFFFANGQKIQKYYPIYEKINSLWLEILNKKGYTYDCNKNKKSYKYNALGILKHNDKDALKRVSYVLSYMAKDEQKEGIEDKYKYGLSKVPKPSGRGRPRKN
ncbi:inovirus-type Gp2 protein [Orbus sasakiae]|uniref:Inovirus-type Gp2 protein n=1 Tax=Orbus sasakiae TaxID=1078475 RepID=A0ABP9N2C9_9GAMM